MSDRARIAVCQTEPVLLDLAANVAATAAVVRDCVGRGADVIVLPELATCGYMFETVEEARAAAVGLDHEVFRVWRAALGSGDGVLVAGFAEAGADGRLYNSAVVLDRTGIRTVYRKTHLWHREKRFFTPGDLPPAVVETPHGRIGVLICYDLEFPEMPRTLALAGADLVAAPTNWSRAEIRTGSEPPQILMARAAARASHVYVAACDRRGVERGQEFTGGSVIIDPEGWPLATPTSDHIALADVTLPTARTRTLTPLNDLFTDRRPTLYTL
ncbi:nitrilase-related carbon-nitrogen hydrolase [Actinocorallia sp. A-T 12471]|uniref:nitrilase-related carbon-nitrogen hydrolase n=1 Tax=Actinocorallia sp. A-T 12471 TaxID=3089813 RepID=UPI0029D3B989|nr:nitrilase-related carbon-nitrogen hydrolase [Actinocorallia sp. A-T 12471]MDX6742299.1 nitrilase-related carbon-nitrogen hydrolase [Actinocorallia sp. A-T 12471]